MSAKIKLGGAAQTSAHACYAHCVCETGRPQALRGDLYFAARDCDARPFMSQIDTEMTPFDVLGGEYDWSCNEEHTNAIKERMPRARVILNTRIRQLLQVGLHRRLLHS